MAVKKTNKGLPFYNLCTDNAAVFVGPLHCCVQQAGHGVPPQIPRTSPSLFSRATFRTNETKNQEKVKLRAAMPPSGRRVSGVVPTRHLQAGCDGDSARRRRR